MWRGNSIRGFTLLELCCVIAITGILAAVAAPKFVSTAPFDTRGYTDVLAGVIRASESAAAASGCDVQLTITPGTGYSANLPATGTTCSGGYTVPVLQADGSALAGTPPSDADVSASITLVFQPNGAVAAPTPIVNPTTVTVVSSPAGAAQPLTLQIDALSGFVTDP
jgi:MSHA pilin protein MshC